MMPQTSNPQKFRVRRSDGKLFDVAENDLDYAINLGGEVIDNVPISSNKSQQTNQDTKIRVKRRDGKEFNIPESQLQRAKKLGGIVVEPPPVPEEPDTWGQLAARSAKSVASVATGGMMDIASALYNIPASIQNATTELMKKENPDYMGENDFIPASQQQPLPLIPSASHAIESGIDTITGGYTNTPEGSSGQEALKMMTSVATPGGLAKLALKGGQHGISKILGALGTTKLPGIAAAGTAGAATSEASKAGYGAPASIGTGLVAGGAVGGVTAAAKAFNAKIALATLTGNSPKNINLDAVRAAEASGLPFTNTLVNESKGLALVEQGVSKAPYFGTKYGKELEANDKAYGLAVENAINKVGEKIIDSDSSLDIGSMIKDTFTGVKQSVIDKKNSLYQEAMSYLPEDASIIPNNLIKAIDDIRKKSRTLKPSPDESFVLNYLQDIEKGIVLGAKENRIVAPVPVDMMAGSKVSINDIINWDVNASGAKNQLKKIQHAIKTDLEAYGKQNPKWYKKFVEADEFYGTYLGDEALGSDTLRKKIFAQENPEKIIGSLNKISDFKNLNQSLGADKSGQQLFYSIKREKLTDLLMGKVIDPKSERVNYLGFSKTMDNKENKELIKYLAGDKYEDLVNFNKYAKAAFRRNQRNPNPSGTASTKTVLNAFGAAFTGTIAGGIAGGITGGIAPLLGATGVGYAAKWLISNNKPLKWGIEAAKKQASGNYKAADTYYRRIEQAMKKDLGDDFVRQFIALSEQKQQD